QLSGNEPVRGIDRVVLSLRTGHLVTRLIESERLLLDAVIFGATMHLESRQSSLDPERTQTAQDLLAYLLVGLQPVNPYATNAVRLEPRCHAGIADVALTGILDVQLAATVSTP